MHVRFISARRLKYLAAGALLLACAAAFNAELQAPTSPGVTITPIPLPVVDGGIGFASPDAAAVRTPSAPDAWGGLRSGSEPTLSDRVVDYQIEATLDPVRHTVAGKQKLTWRNRSKLEVRSVYLHLYMNAFESADSTFFTERLRQARQAHPEPGPREGEWGHIELRRASQNGAAITWSFVHPDQGPARDHTVVRFDLPTPIAAGASSSFDIEFLTQLPRVIARTGYFDSFHLVGQWFPKIGVLELPGERGAAEARWNVHEFHMNSEFYADFGNYDVRLTVPAGYTVGATGEPQGTPVEKNGLVTHHYVQGDVHDFAWTADKRSVKPLEDTWRGPGSPAVKLSVIYPPEYAASAAPAMKAAKDTLSYFSNMLGPYPYKTLTVVIPPYNAEAAGGMEYPTFVTAEGYRKVAPASINAQLLDVVTIHETGHGYFYGILASNEFEEPMLDEGMDEYWSARMMRERGQDLQVSTGAMKAFGLNPTFKVFDYERFMAPLEEPADPLGQNAWNRLQGLDPVYTRGATVMRDLEERIGKSATERAFKEYYQRWKFRHPSIADLREALADASGQRAAVEAVFAQQVYQASKVDDRVGALTSVELRPQPESAKRSGRYPFLTTVTLRRRGAAVPQTLIVKFADGSTETVAWNNAESWRRFSWTKPARAVSAELDPARVHYLDVNKLDDSRTVDADARASRRWGSDFAAIVQILFALVANL